MNESDEYITLDIELPSGYHQEVTAPARANVQQFIDSLVTRLDLPVIHDDGAAIHYRLDDADTGTPINEAQTVLASGLIDGSQLQLIPHNGAGLTISLDPPLPKPSARSGKPAATPRARVRELLLDAGFWQAIIALLGGIFILYLTIRLRNILFGITGGIVIFAAIAVLLYKLQRYDII